MLDLSLSLGLTQEQFELVRNLKIGIIGQSLHQQMTNAALQRTAWENTFISYSALMTYFNASDGGTFGPISSGGAANDTWYDDVNDVPGVVLNNAVASFSANDITPNVLTINLGQSDAGRIISTSTKAQVKEAYKGIIDYLRSLYGNINCYVHNFGSLQPVNDPNGDYPPSVGRCQLIREIWWELITENAYIKYGGESYDLERQDKFHLLTTVRDEYARREALAIIAQETGAAINWKGPQVTSVELENTNRLWVQCELPTDKTWNSDMNFFGNGSLSLNPTTGFTPLISVFKNGVRTAPSSIILYDDTLTNGTANKFRLNFGSNTFSSTDVIDVYIMYDWGGIDNGDNTYLQLQRVRSSQSSLPRDEDNLPLRPCHYQADATGSTFVRQNPLV